MADFKTHLTISTSLGAVYAGTAYWHYQVPESTCLLAGGLCAMAGMLPDLDSNSSRPLRESLAFGAAFVAVMLVNRLEELAMNNEIIVLSGAAVYLLIRFVMGSILRNFTDHRGMFHSIPAALIFGEIAFLLASGNDVHLRIFKAGGLVLGYLSHLVLDEVYSLQMKPGKVRIKKSFGTALKIFRPDRLFVNLVVYAMLVGLGWVAFNEPQWARQLLEERGGKTARLVQRTTEKMSQVAQRLRDYRDRHRSEGTVGELGELLQEPLVLPSTTSVQNWIGDDLRVKERLGRFLSEKTDPPESGGSDASWFAGNRSEDDSFAFGKDSDLTAKLDQSLERASRMLSDPTERRASPLLRSAAESIFAPQASDLGAAVEIPMEKNGNDRRSSSEGSLSAPLRIAREPDIYSPSRLAEENIVPAPPPPPEYR